MSRILKALATIESKGATLTLSLPKEPSPLQPKRREGAERAEMSLAALEAYLQAALSAEQQLLLEADVSDAVALYCTPGEVGPSIGALDLVAAELDEENAVTAWGTRDSGPRARYSFVDRELAEVFLEDTDVSPVAATNLESLGAIDFTLIPADDVLESAQAELLDWDNSLYDVPLAPAEASAAPDVEATPAFEDGPACESPEIDPFETLVFHLTGDLSIEACGFFTESEPSAATELVAPPTLAGWPDAFPLEAAAEPTPEIDVTAATWFISPPEFRWLEGYDLTPSEAHEQHYFAAPDWIEVDAAIEALPLIVEKAPTPPTPIEVAPPRTVARQRLTSRDLLPDPTAWAECRAVADTLRAARVDGKPANYLVVELSPVAGRAPLAAPLAAMLAEVSGNRMLLVDTDCWRGDAVDQLSGETLPGFADVLRRPDNWPGWVLSSAVPRLDLLPAGSWTAPPLRAGREFAAAEWLATLSRAYDIVLLHASWPGGETLASLAAAADATLIVAPLGNLEEHAAEQAVSRLRQWGAQIAGCVVVGGE